MAVCWQKGSHDSQQQSLPVAGDTALHLAARTGDDDVVRTLGLHFMHDGSLVGNTSAGRARRASEDRRRSSSPVRRRKYSFVSSVSSLFSRSGTGTPVRGRSESIRKIAELGRIHDTSTESFSEYIVQQFCSF